MNTSWYQKASEFKSPKHVVAAFLCRSREKRMEQVQNLKDENQRLRLQLELQRRSAAVQQNHIESLNKRCDELGQQVELAKQSVNLPLDQPIGTHGYGVRMITLAANLGRSVGLRGAHRVLKIFSNGSDSTTNFRLGRRFATGFND